jgi:hypothetical protein
MKFILTVYICSSISGECVIPQDKESGFNYPKEYGTHYGCVRDGLGESFEILFNGDYFNSRYYRNFINYTLSLLVLKVILWINLGHLLN